jgi:hypothetical protein
MIDACRVVHGYILSTSEWTIIVVIERLGTTDRCGIDTWNVDTFRRGTLRNVPAGVFTRSKTNRYYYRRKQDRCLPQARHGTLSLKALAL